MTQDEIVKMAQPEQEPVAWKETDEVECPVCNDKGFPWPKCGHITYLERTQPQRKPSEREKVAAWMIQRGYATGHGDTTEDLLKELEWQIAERVAAERERCAEICDSIAANAVLGTANECARAIRNQSSTAQDGHKEK